MSETWTYDFIKQRAAQCGKSVTDYLVLAPQNDPFYMNAPANLIKGQWFAKVYTEYDIRTGSHIRRIHYALASAMNPPQMPTGEVYTNTEECWQYLLTASKPARYLGLVDPDAFDDRKNPPAIIHWTDEAMYGQRTTAFLRDSSLDDLGLSETLDPPQLIAPSYSTLQHYQMEIWCEKTTMNDVLIPLCKSYQANLVTGAGELTVTAVSKLLQRRREGHPIRILYVSDFDPAGQCMPVSIARKIEHFVHNRAPSADVKLYPVVLTAEQCKTYELPRIPIKESERRKEKFEQRHGGGATELDALEAIRPGELRRILERELDRYYDDALRSEAAEAECDYQNDLDDLNEQAAEQHRAELDAIQADYGKALKLLRGVREKAASVWEDIRNELSEAELADPAEYAPEPKLVTDEPWALYDSTRSYEDQLPAYRRFKDGEE